MGGSVNPIPPSIPEKVCRMPHSHCSTQKFSIVRIFSCQAKSVNRPSKLFTLISIFVTPSIIRKNLNRLYRTVKNRISNLGPPFASVHPAHCFEWMRLPAHSNDGHIPNSHTCQKCFLSVATIPHIHPKSHTTITPLF